MQLFKWMRPEQAGVILDVLEGEEGQHFDDLLDQWEPKLDVLPKLYEHEGKDPAVVPVVLHYFNETSDWWITEVGEDGIAYGFVCLNGWTDCAELGYMDLNELKSIGADFDLYWEVKSLKDVMDGVWHED